MDSLPIAVRVYPDLARKATARRQHAPLPDAMLVFDCETRANETQELTFGTYRFIVKGRCLEEGLFYAEDLAPDERAILERYVTMHRANTSREGVADLKLLSVKAFRELVHRLAFKGRCLLVAFNFPFDASRIALDYGIARGRYAGGFSFVFWQYEIGGNQRPHPYRPRVAVKHIDSKRSLKGFTGGMEADAVDRIPEGSADGIPRQDYIFPGQLLDVRTAVFALTDRGHTLESACEAFGLPYRKLKVTQHGVITPEYIDYNRRDVQLTADLALVVLAEYDRHPIDLPVTRAYSPASIGKAYLHAMGIEPILTRQPSFPKARIGHAQSAFYGGRASAHIRKVPVPVVYTDFLSEYSTVNVLMGLWDIVTAERIDVLDNCEAELTELLREVTPEWALQRENWKRLRGFARIIPDGDVLPVRAKYGANDWQIGINHVYQTSQPANGGLWYAWPELAASVLLTGKLPRIVEAFKVVPVGQLQDLAPIAFRGQVPIDPRTQDFFRAVIEERKRLARRADLSDTERVRLDKTLKTLGSATSYGIFAQMDRKESERKMRVCCYGIDDASYECSVSNPEAPGEYCFPPLSSLVTSGGRLLLALLERLVTDRGGTYAMEDTDSMAIVSSARGGLVACPGGPYRLRDGREAIRALSWQQVREIVDCFARLNPYDSEAVPDSVLKIEDDNVDPKTGKQRQLWCYAISAKRYALFLRRPDGTPELLQKGVNNYQDRWSEHGLGHLLNPIDPEREDREWIAHAWLRMIRKALGYRTKALPFAHVPAVGRVNVSSPTIMRALASLNAGKPYAKQIKPFNFLLSAQVQELGLPPDADPDRFHLIAPYESNPSKWLSQQWIEQYSGRRYRVSFSQTRGRNVVALKTYGDVLEAYEYHPELKCAGPNGEASDKRSVGLLRRRHARIDEIRFIGKESNRLEKVQQQGDLDPEQIYTEYFDARRDEWATKILPKLKAMPLAELIRRSGLSRAALQAIRAGRRPHPRNCQVLRSIALNRLS